MGLIQRIVERDRHSVCKKTAFDLPQAQWLHRHRWQNRGSLRLRRTYLHLEQSLGRESVFLQPWSFDCEIHIVMPTSFNLHFVKSVPSILPVTKAYFAINILSEAFGQNE